MTGRSEPGRAGTLGGRWLPARRPGHVGRPGLVGGLGVVGGLGLLVGAASTLARYLPPAPGLAPDTWAMVTTFSDAGLLAYGVALLGFGSAALLARRGAPVVGLVLSLALTATHASWLVPRWWPDGDRAASPVVRVLAQNLLFGRADPAAVLAAAASADVLVLTEITTPAARALAEAGLERDFPHLSSGELPWDGAQGTRVYSRFPLRDGRALDPATGDHTWRVEVEVPGLGPLTVVAAHPTRPFRGGSGWAAEQRQLSELSPRERTVVAGDFNAVDSHPGLRRFRALGFRDSDEVRGARWHPTYPAQGRVPPLIAIDHVLVSADLTATAFSTVPMPGSDHRGVLAGVALRA